MIKLFLNTLISFVICLGIFICFEAVCFKNHNYIASNLSPFNYSTISENNTQKSSDSYNHIISLMSSDKNKKEHKDKSSSNEIQKLLHNTSRCIRSKFRPIK